MLACGEGPPCAKDVHRPQTVCVVYRSAWQQKFAFVRCAAGLLGDGREANRHAALRTLGRVAYGCLRAGKKFV